MIDPSIPLQVRPPQFADPLEQAGKAMNLLAARQQIAMAPIHAAAAQEQLRAAQLENQQRQQAFADDAAGRQLFAGIQSGGAMPADTEILAKLGPTHGSAIVKSLREADKAHADLQKTRGEVATQEQDYAGGLAAMVKAAGYAPEAVQLAIQHAHQAGYEEQAKQLLPLLQPENQGKIRPLMDSLIQQSPAQQKLITEATAANARAATAETGKTKEAREAGQQQFQNAISDLGANPPQNAAEYQQRLGGLPATVASRILQSVPVAQYDAAKSPSALRKLGMTADQQAQTENATAQLTEAIKRDAESQRNHLADESIRRTALAVQQGRLGQEQMVNGMKYGPGTTEYWVKQLQDNPDSVKEMPPELRSTVGKGFTAATNLPLPTPLSEGGKTQETAARNALDGITFIRQAMQNPEIQKNIGPIMGRLGEASQAIGTAVGLSPEAERLAQELRTRMRYFVFQEGKAVLGGRLPQNLMGALEKSSANVKMDPAMLEGALSGAENNAQSILDNTDRQRFGGRMRTREMRNPGAQPEPAAPAGGKKPLSEIFK